MNIITPFKTRRASPPANDRPVAAGFDDLLAERARLDGEMSRFGVVDQRLAAAERKLAEVEAGLAAVSRADREATERWAHSPEGEAPMLLITERRALLARQLDAQAEVEASRIASEAVAPRRVALIERMNAIDVKFRDRKLSTALIEARELHAEAVRLAGEFGQRFMRLEGLRQCLIEQQAAAVSGNNEALAAATGAALREVEKLRPPEVMAERDAVVRHVGEWKAALR